MLKSCPNLEGTLSEFLGPQCFNLRLVLSKFCSTTAVSKNFRLQFLSGQELHVERHHFTDDYKIVVWKVVPLEAIELKGSCIINIDHARLSMPFYEEGCAK